MRWTPLGTSLLGHVALAGGLVLSRGCGVHASDARGDVVELAIVAASPAPPPAPEVPSPAAPPAAVPSLGAIAEEEHPHLGGGGGRSIHPAAEAPTIQHAPVVTDEDDEAEATATDVPHATLDVAAPAGDAHDLQLEPSGPRPTELPGAGTGGGRGGGEGGGRGAGSGTGLGRAARRPARPINAREHAILPYPEKALEWKVSGTVRLLITVGADGNVQDVVVTERLGYGLDRIAVDEARKLRFEPGLDVDGRPIPVRVRWSYTFEPP